MALKKFLFKPGVNRENTRYTTEGGWYDCDKIRFRQGTPEKIGGWQRISVNFFLGVCRSIWNWVTLAGENLLGVGTNLKFYIEQGGFYYDVTPIRLTTAAGEITFAASTGSSTITVTDTAHGALADSYVTYFYAVGLGGNVTAAVLNQEYQITKVIDANSYEIVVGVTATAGDSGTGGAATVGQYQINAGPVFAEALTGWGAGTWGTGAWGFGSSPAEALRLWSQQNFGEDLIFGRRGGELYYWDASVGTSANTFTVTIASPAVVTFTNAMPELTQIQLVTTGTLPTGLAIGVTYYVRNVSGLTANLSLTAAGALITTSGTQSGVHTTAIRAIPLSTLSGASDVPTVQNYALISDISRFVFAFGCNDIGTTIQDPMLVRWSDQEDAANWTPSATNQAGSVRFSKGSEIVTALQGRQEILAWTDSSLYSLQYVGAPIVWSSQIVGDNISIVSQNSVAYANGVAYWMGVDKFYMYDGRTQTLKCDLRRFIFSDIDVNQHGQIFAGTNEGFNEIWWFYCSSGSTIVDRYVIFNYSENAGQGAWYYGTMGRTAWLDSGLREFPLAATYVNNLVNHEQTVDDNSTPAVAPIEAYITSSEFDIEDGHNFAFVWRVLPDITFSGSTADNPAVTMYLRPLKNSGSGYTTPASVGGEGNAAITRTATVPVEQFTGQVFIRIRGRQMAFEVRSTELGVNWQLGAPRFDIRPDGRR
jgi:hypothetical protein